MSLPNYGIMYDGALQRKMRKGDGPVLALGVTALTTVGAGTLLAASLQTGYLRRTGPTGAVADTLDTGANLDAAFPNMAIGDVFDVWYSNNVGFAITITASAGVTLGTAAANNIIAANTGRLLHFEKTAAATYVVDVI